MSFTLFLQNHELDPGAGAGPPATTTTTITGARRARRTTAPGGPRAAPPRALKMAAATGRAAGAAPPGYTGEEQRGTPGEGPGGYTGEGQSGAPGAAPAGYAGEGQSGAGAAAASQSGASLAALQVKFSERQRSSHCLLVKEHQVREGADTAHPPRRTLFVLNVPPYCGPVSGGGRAEAGPCRPGSAVPGAAVGGGPGWGRESSAGCLRGASLLLCCTGNFLLLSRVKDSLSRLFSRCGHVQSVDIYDKRGSGEKKENLTSKFFDQNTVKVNLGREKGMLMLSGKIWQVLNGSLQNMSHRKPYGALGDGITYLSLRCLFFFFYPTATCGLIFVLFFEVICTAVPCSITSFSDISDSPGYFFFF